jgi:hypothetical protein
LLHILLVILAALSAALDHGLNVAAGVQLAILVVSSFGVYFLPLVKWKYAGALKVADAAIAAALTALAPLVLQGSISGSQWITVALAGLSVVGVALGIDARATNQPAIAVLSSVPATPPAAPPAPPAAL